MMRKTISIALFVMLFWACASANAAPSLNGSTGMINTPTADVLRDGQVSFGVYKIKDGYSGSINMNLAPNLEIGLTGQRYAEKVNLPNNTCFNAKFALAPETILTPGIAVGVEDVANMDKRSWYASASKGLIFGIRMHVGYGNGRYDGFFAAIEKSINPVTINGIGSTNFIAEWDGSQLNYGLRMTVAAGLKVDAGMRKNHGYLGVSFTS